MKRGALDLLAISVAVFVMMGTVSAHHVITAKFDPSESLTLTGSVTKVDWLNPHVHIFMDVEDGAAITAEAAEKFGQGPPPAQIIDAAGLVASEAADSLAHNRDTAQRSLAQALELLGRG